MKKFVTFVLLGLLISAFWVEVVGAYPHPHGMGRPVIVVPPPGAPLPPPPDAPLPPPPDAPNPPPAGQPPHGPGSRQMMMKESGAELAINGGYIAGTVGAGVSLAANRLFDIPNLAARLGYAHATDTKDVGGATRENEIALLDLILKLNPPGTRGLRSYLGLGSNYIFNTTGPTSGAIGGQAFYGVEGNLGGGELFFEVGYGIIRPRISEDRSGGNVLLGYKIGW